MQFSVCIGDLSGEGIIILLEQMTCRADTGRGIVKHNLLLYVPVTVV